MKLDKKTHDQAVQIAKENKVATVWVNNKGEFFTVKNYAVNSVHGNKENLAEVKADSKFSEKPGDQGTGSEGGSGSAGGTGTPASKYAGMKFKDLQKELSGREGLKFEVGDTADKMIAKLEADDKAKAAAAGQ